SYLAEAAFIGRNAMSLRLIQLRREDGTRAVAANRGTGAVTLIDGFETTYDLAWAAIRDGDSIDGFVERHLSNISVDLAALERDGRLLPPIDHTDPAHLLLTGT